MEEKDTAARVLAAARRLVARQGPRGATTREIAREAGVNEVTIFRLFGTKARLLREVVAHSLPTRQEAPLARLLERPVADLDGAIALVRDFAAAFAGRALEEQRELLMVAARASEEDPELRALLAERALGVTDLLAGRLQALEADGLLRRGAGPALAHLLVRGLLGGFVLGDEAPDPGALAELLVRGAAAAPSTGAARRG